MPSTPTPNQTVGPFFLIGLAKLYRSEIAGSGDRVTIRGRVLDGDGKPVNDAMLEVWQADAAGHHAGDAAAEAGFPGFARVPTDDDGAFTFTTIKPGRVRGPGGALQAPHLAVAVFMRGLLKHLVTRVYFPDEPSNLDDPVLKLVPGERRATLIATKSGPDPAHLTWNVQLQGPDETVFFDY